MSGIATTVLSLVLLLDRQVLEMDPLELIASVNEIEPENSHTLVISFDTRVSLSGCTCVWECSLLLLFLW